MRILFLNVSGMTGGAERSLLDLLKSLRHCEPAPELHAVLAAEGPLVGALREVGAHVSVLAMPPALLETGDTELRELNRWRAGIRMARRAPAAASHLWRYRVRLRRLIQNLQPSVIHSNSIKFHCLTAWATPPGPLVVWHVRDFLSERPLMAKVLRMAARAADGAIAISQAVANDARTVLPRTPIIPVYNAIDTNHFCPGPGDGAWLDQLAGIPTAAPGVCRVGLLATFARWKGQDVFIEAAARLARDPAPIRFYVIGGPLYQTHGSQWAEAELRARAGTLADEGRVAFIPFQHDPAPIYRALDVVVHASTRAEPFGRTIVEAMACGRPVVAVRAGGSAELFTDGHDALGIALSDAQALAQAIATLAHDPDLRRRLGTQARETAVARFHRDRLGRDVLAAYGRFRQWPIDCA